MLDSYQVIIDTFIARKGNWYKTYAKSNIWIINQISILDQLKQGYHSPPVLLISRV